MPAVKAWFTIELRELEADTDADLAAIAAQIAGLLAYHFPELTISLRSFSGDVEHVSRH